MEAHSGDPSFPIWLIADSEPKNWRDLLLTPLDPRHPARHNIWTSVLEYMQEKLYKRRRLRFDTSKLYIRNAVIDPDEKPKSAALNWNEGLQDKVDLLRADLQFMSPKLVLTFGAFAFELVRRASGEEHYYKYSEWGTLRLGEEFKERLALFDTSKTNVLPLLHASISRGRFLESHRYFVGKEAKYAPNYFEYVGNELAELLLKKLKTESIWVE